MKTINEKKGYVYSNGSCRKSWTRGRTMFSVGKQWTGNNTYIPCIVKTNLDTNEMKIASLDEHKRFLTKESYEEFVSNHFKQLCQGGYI